MIKFIIAILTALLITESFAGISAAHAADQMSDTLQLSDILSTPYRSRQDIPLGHMRDITPLDQDETIESVKPSHKQGWHVISPDPQGKNTLNKAIRLTKINQNLCAMLTSISTISEISACADYALTSLSLLDGRTAISLLPFYVDASPSGAAAGARKAAVILLSLGGNTMRAHQLSEQNQSLANVFWHILSEVGSIQDLYQYSASEDRETILAVPIRTKKKVIDRLLRSALPNSAQKWIEASTSVSLHSRYVKLRISTNDYKDLEAKNANAGYLLSLAHQGEGDIEKSLSWFQDRDFKPELHYAEKLKGEVQPEDRNAWGDLSRHIPLPADIDELPVLKASRALIDHSEATRQSLEALIAQVSNPDSSAQSRFEFSD